MKQKYVVGICPHPGYVMEDAENPRVVFKRLMREDKFPAVLPNLLLQPKLINMAIL